MPRSVKELLLLLHLLHISVAPQPLWTLTLFQFLNLYKVGRTPWTGDQRVARPLPTHGTTQTQNKSTQASIPRVVFEPTIPAFEREKTVHALDRAATVIGLNLLLHTDKNCFCTKIVKCAKLEYFLLRVCTVFEAHLEGFTHKPVQKQQQYIYLSRCCWLTPRTPSTGRPLPTLRSEQQVTAAATEECEH
jgi:hypothetical protein